MMMHFYDVITHAVHSVCAEMIGAIGYKLIVLLFFVEHAAKTCIGEVSACSLLSCCSLILFLPSLKPYKPLRSTEVLSPTLRGKQHLGTSRKSFHVLLNVLNKVLCQPLIKLLNSAIALLAFLAKDSYVYKTKLCRKSVDMPMS